MSGQRILVVHADSSARHTLATRLRAGGKEYVVETAEGMASVPIYMSPPRPDIAVLGCDFVRNEGAWLLPCRQLRALEPSRAMGIVLVVSGLPPGAACEPGEAGADACLPAEDLGRLQLHDSVRRVLDRAGRRRAGTAQAGPFRLTRLGRVVSAGGAEIPVSPSEFEFLWLVVSGQGKRVAYADFGRTLHAVHVMAGRVRKALGPWGDLISNDRGVGYHVELELGGGGGKRLARWAPGDAY